MSDENKDKPASEQTVDVPAEPKPGPLAIPGTADPDEMLALLERRANVLGRLLDVAIKATHPGQWTNQGGKPYPTAAAAEVMARRCLVSLRDVKYSKIESTDEKGQYYLYVCTGTFKLPGENDSVEAIGTCSMRDQFFSQAHGKDVPQSKIDEGNIMKSAYSNMMVNGVTRLLGVRNLTWERLEALGIRMADTQSVDYKKGSAGSDQTADDPMIPRGFGKWGGKRLSEINDKDLADLLKACQENVDKKDEKWHAANVKRLGQVKKESARRAGSTQGQQTTSPSATATSGSGNGAGGGGGQSAASSPGQPQKSVYQRIVELAEEKWKVTTKDDIHAAIKEGTGKTKSSELTDDDLDKVDRTFAKWEADLQDKVAEQENRDRRDKEEAEWQ